MMKNKLFILLFLIFSFCSCNNDKIILKIVYPEDGATFLITQPIDVQVTATTKKGDIIQVYLEMDTFFRGSITHVPFNFTIPPNAVDTAGLYPISVMAYSSKGVKEGDAIFIKITE